jgi:hypothetical protein
MPLRSIARAFEAAGFDFEGIVTTLSVAIDPLPK